MAKQDMAEPIQTGTPKNNALAVIQAACAVYEEAWSKLGKAVALQRVLGQDISRAQRLRASASQKITFYNRLFHEIEAASNVVKPPTVQEIQDTRALIAQVENLTVADAAASAGLQLIQDAVNKASAATSGVRPA